MAKKHTSLYIDEALLGDAERLLETSGPTETVNAALREAANLVRRRRFLSDPMISLTDDDLQQMKHETGPFAEES